MGNVFSSASARVQDTVNVNISESETMDTSETCDDTLGEGCPSNEEEDRAKIKEKEMTDFYKELSVKREQRRQILERHKAEKQELEKSLDSERKSRLELYETNKRLREILTSNNIEIPEDLLSNDEDADIKSTIAKMKEEFEDLRTSNKKLRRDLVESNNALQNAYSDIADLNAQNKESLKQISALKEVVTVSKTMIALREQQLDELKNKLSEIEQSLADREATMLSNDLRQEYERQLQNIRTLRGLYEERARLAEVTRQSLVRELEEQKLLYQAEVNKNKNLADKVKELEDKIDALIETIENKNNQISVCQDESMGLRAEMTVVNKLFSEVLLGYKTKNDLDKLVHRLEENHGILTQLAERENDLEASTALPKLLLELVNQVDEGEGRSTSEFDTNESNITANEFPGTDEREPTPSTSTSAEEIVQNLPKVWRVLMELLSHQNVVEANPAEKVTTCYKSVETKSGPVLVPSVSQTYIRLKDLIIEKLALIKEVNRMKQLNSHLETRLEEQERRLCLVTTELSKTWHVVGRLRRHHHQLHTHEKILKYELQQKRKLLNELKEELEYCREKWEQAREKNTQSEKDWRKLRAEFSSRKVKPGSPSFNNSAESGYSDERPSDESSESNDESEYVTEPLIRCKKKMKKSFETILDSSTDFNLVAEREDPVSDMIDVADLPLDTQDESHSENIEKSEMLCEETEDEVCDIVNDSCIEESSTMECNLEVTQSIPSQNPSSSIDCKKDLNSLTRTIIDPAEILKNVQQQNERLAKKDEKLQELEKSSKSLLMKVQDTSRLSDQLNSTLDHILSHPSTSRETTQMDDSSTEVKTNNNEKFGENTENDSLAVSFLTASNDKAILEIDFKAILENVKKQDERLAEKDKRLDKLENDCSKVVTILNKTLDNSGKIKDRLEELHNARANDGNAESKIVDNIAGTNGEDSEPSTSSEIDHEARFAARDLRLKRLEEQTKSLVKKVNKTNSKRVKIHYKLEELHNIYGSEGSRAGTPSEDTEEKVNEEDEKVNEDDTQD